jgi:hypothetical protein
VEKLLRSEKNSNRYKKSRDWMLNLSKLKIEKVVRRYVGN